MPSSALAAARRAKQTLERPADVGGDVADRALRLGASALGCSLIYTEEGTLADADGGRSPALPARAFEETAPALGSEGERFGTVRAVDLAARKPLDWNGRRALADVAALIAGDVATRQRLGQFDHITGLPNRRRFASGFSRAVLAAGNDPCLALVTVAEASHFNKVLRALGHDCAEAFVRASADMLRAAIGPSYPLFHVSALSFAFLAKGAVADELGRAVVSTFAEPVMSGTLPITTRVGVGLAPVEAGVRPAEALRSALAAAQDSRASESGFAHYDRSTDQAHVRAFRLLTDLDEALRDYGQLSLAYQPRIDLASGRAIGAEALIRWTHPAIGAVSPADFIPLAETTALMAPLTDFVMTRAFRQSAAWRGDGLDVKVSVNISPTSLGDASFLERVDRLIESAGADPSRLEFEFTEGTLASAQAGARDMIDAIRSRGFGVAIDDFGTGFSNLGYLTRLPADVLKIDRSLVMGIDADGRRAKLCRAMIELAQDLDFHVVAEGVETQAVYDMLTNWGCDEGQGFFMSRPLTAPAFAAFATSR